MFIPNGWVDVMPAQMFDLLRVAFVLRIEDYYYILSLEHDVWNQRAL